VLEGSPLNPWIRVTQWLRSAPITDPVDRRNASVVQFLLFCYGFLLPANWAWHAGASGISKGWMTVVVLDMMVASFALAGIWMIRRGRFRQAVMLFLGVLLASLEVVYLRLGAQSQLVDQVTPTLVLMISGLVLGRRALWIAFGCLMVVFCTGFASDIARAVEHGESVMSALDNAPAMVIPAVLMAAILDRTISALRESLDASLAHSRELQREMAERERTQAQLVHAQKMEAAGRLASGVAHDFNNVLGVILGLTTQRHRLDDPASDARQDAMAMAFALEGVEDAARRGTAINRKLLSFSRHEPIHAQTFDVVEAMRDIAPMLRWLMGDRVRLRLSLAEDVLPIHIDRGQFELMLLNVAANSRDAMPDGGEFEVRVSRVASPEPGVGIELSDNGQGMGDAVRQRAFEPFFTTKPQGSGTGLGLSVAYNLVRHANGEIEIESAPGRGTTLRVRLPHAPFEPEGTPAHEPSMAEPEAV